MNYQLLKDIMGSKIPSDVVYYTGTFLNVMDRMGLGFHFQKKMKKYTETFGKSIQNHPGLSPYYIENRKQTSFRLIHQTTYDHNDMIRIYNKYSLRMPNFRIRFVLDITTSYSPNSSFIIKTICMTIKSNYGKLTLNIDGLYVFSEYTVTYHPYSLDFIQTDLCYELNEDLEDNTKMLKRMSQFAIDIEKIICVEDDDY